MELDEALESVFDQVESGLGSTPADFAILFTTETYIDSCFEISRRIRDRIAPRALIGCTGGGIIGSGEEYEDQPAISLLVGSLPGVTIQPFYLDQSDIESMLLEDDDSNPFNIPAGEKPTFILLPDPFSVRILELLSFLDRAYPDSVKIGGMASAGFQPGANRIYMNGQTYHSGLVGVAMWGEVDVIPLVSQGCRPIGSPFLVTSAEENIIQRLGQQSALEAVQGLLEDLAESDRRLAQRALLVGVVIDEYKTDFKRGDFLIRNLIGADPSTGAVVLNDQINVGQTLQFQVRDARTAEEDLTCLLESARRDFGGRTPAACTVFSCNGRGLRLYSERNRDISLVHRGVGEIPGAGFFCAGEIGPIGGKSFVHGFTSSIGFILPKAEHSS